MSPSSVRDELTLTKFSIPMIRLVLLKRYGFPSLFLQWPVTLFRLIRLFQASGDTGSIYCFSGFEIWLRAYYEKIARNFREAGRFGYVWDEALGLPMGPRLYNNWVTYEIYGALSARAFSLLTAGSFLFAVALLGSAVGNPLQAAAMVLLLIASPAVIFSMIAYMIKPEIIWWALSVSSFVLALCGLWPPVWLLLGVLLLVNTTVSVITGAVLAVLCGVQIFSSGGIPGGFSILWLLPGMAKQLLRFAYSYREGFLRQTTDEQKKILQKTSWPGMLASAAALFLLPLFLASWGQPAYFIILGTTGTALYIANLRLMKFADTVTMQMLFLSILVSSAIVSGSWISAVGVALFAYVNPIAYAAGIMGQARQNPERLPAAVEAENSYSEHEGLLKSFPWLQPMPLPEPPAIMRMLGVIPNGSRILFESDGDSRRESKYLRFRGWTNEFLPAGQIELVNQNFLVRLAEPLLADRYLDCFNAHALSPGSMRAVCENLGVSYVIAFSPETAAALQGLGYRLLYTASYEDFRDFAALMEMPERDLMLLENPEPADVLYPTANWSRKGNSLTWEAAAGHTYTVRYRFDEKFSAVQEGSELSIESCTVFDDLPLKFMKVRAERDGLLTLKFKPRWI